MAIEDELNDSRARLKAAEARKTRAEGRREAAGEKVAQAKAKLLELGIKTNDDAKRILAELDQQAETAAAKAEQALTDAGA